MWDEEDVAIPYEILVEKVKSVDGLFCLLTENIDRALIESASKLKVISTMAVGYNNIDVEAASEKGIVVTHTPGVLTETTADLTFALLMATARRLVEASDVLRKGQWSTWSPLFLSGQDIYGSTLGIIGFGSIGQAVARRAKGFNMEVLYYNRSRKLDAEKEIGVIYSDVKLLLRKSDFVCILTPLTPETTNLISHNEFALMKSSSVLINTARGGIVDEEALFEALKSGTIWAAGLDVFEEEPVSLNHPLLTLPNVITLPHIGSSSVKTRTAMAKLAATNLLQVLRGEHPKYPVNKEVL